MFAAPAWCHLNPQLSDTANTLTPKLLLIVFSSFFYPPPIMLPPQFTLIPVPPGTPAVDSFGSPVVVGSTSWILDIKSLIFMLCMK